MKPAPLLSLLAFAAAVNAANVAHAADLFPFVLPWDDASESATNISWLNDKPAGRDGFVQVKDGHLFAGGKRLRIFGVNTCFAANFPDKDMAPKVAARMAKFGINCVRFHHMDMMSAPGGIFAKDGRTLDPGQLDRLDFFIAELKKNGIYADLNLHVSRTYPDRPREEKKGNPDYDKGVDNFCAAMIALQKDYARDLLTHVNAYTGNRYADEPAVALVEINNENALGRQWFGGEMDSLPAPYLAEMETLWGAWIAKRHGSDEKARTAWSVGAQAAGAEMLRSAGNPAREGTDPRGGLCPRHTLVADAAGGALWRVWPGIAARGGPAPWAGLPALQWSFEQHGGAAQTHSEKDGAITVNVEKPGTEPWHVQFSAAPLAVKAESYEVRFRVRAPKDTGISVAIMQSHEPWKVLGSANVKAGTEWREVSVTFRTGNYDDVTFRTGASDDKARLTLGGMGLTQGVFEFSGFSLRTAGLDGSLVRDVSGDAKNAPGRVPMLRKRDLSRHTPAKQRDWQEFIWDTETAYWNGMRDFLRKDLGVRVPVVGTQGFWSPGHVQAGMDVIDSHAYWHHPDFHGRGWNADVWSVKNEPMAGAPDGGTLPGLAAQRVAGKPFLCTEYNHPAPNTYSAETFPLLCAFAALQDWDGVFAFSYSHRGAGEWAQESFNNFFDIDRHTVKMATLPAAVISFRRGDVWANGFTVVAGSARKYVLEDTLQRGPLSADLDNFRLQLDRARMATDVSDSIEGAYSSVNAVPPSGHFRWGKVFRANGEHAGRFAFVDTTLSRLLVGRIAAKESVAMTETDLSTIVMGDSRQGWACLQMTVLDRDAAPGDGILIEGFGNWVHFATAKRILITATGDIENTGMGWKNAEKTSVGRDWGKAPVLVEGPAAKIELPGGGKFKAWALDERGQRRAEIPVAMESPTGATLEIGPQHRTLWYEVVRE